MKKNVPSALPIQYLETSDCIAKFATWNKPAQYPSFDYLHGFLCAITTTPSQVALAEWSEVLHQEISFSTAKQEEEAFGLLVPMTNGLIRQIHEKRLEIPANANLQDWALGFDTAHREFKHLWDIILGEIEEALQKPELGKELWNKLVLAWTALRTPGNPEAFQMLRRSPEFEALTEPDFQAKLRTELEANLRFLGSTCDNIIQVYRQMPRQ